MTRKAVFLPHSPFSASWPPGGEIFSARPFRHDVPALERLTTDWPQSLNISWQPAGNEYFITDSLVLKYLITMLAEAEGICTQANIWSLVPV